MSVPQYSNVHLRTSLTLQETLVFCDFSSIVQFLKVLRPLREFFSLDERVALVRDDIRSGTVQLCDGAGQIDAWWDLNTLIPCPRPSQQNQSFPGFLTSPSCNGTLEFIGPLREIPGIAGLFGILAILAILLRDESFRDSKRVHIDCPRSIDCDSTSPCKYRANNLSIQP